MTQPHSVVTGGTGYVGRFIVEALLEAGHRVTVMGRNAPAPDLFSRAVGYAPLSLEPEAVREQGVPHCDYLVHCAFDHLPGRYRGGEGNDPQGFERRNREGSLALFEEARRRGAKRTVFLSTRAVYGTKAGGKTLGEDEPLEPETLYGVVKRDVEAGLKAMSTEDFITSSLRVTGVYGSACAGGEHKWSALFSQFLNGEAIEPRVATEVHGKDVAAAVRLMLEAPGAAISGHAFNVSDLLLDRRDLLAIVKEKAGREGLVLPERGDASAVNAMETGKLHSLGWVPGGWHLLEKSVTEMLAHGFT